MGTPLTVETLSRISGRAAVPAYDRSRVTPGIVHIGVGGFHRAHEAVYLDDLLALGQSNDWGICGAGLLPQDYAMAGTLQSQDCLYTVTARDSSGDSIRVVGAMVDYIFAPTDPERLQRALAAPDTRIVSLTITEGGYSGDTDFPGSAFHYLAEALARRRLNGTPPFTVLSCDNLPHNGDAAKRALLGSVSDPDLAQWVTENAAFPNSMVDRITPQTTEADRQRVIAETGLDDLWPVVCEPFKQWIIEDTFCNGRPVLENVGVQFVPDVAPYETMKLALLNGSHFALAYLGFLAGYQTVPKALADPAFRTFIRRLMDDEVTPLLPPVPGIDLTAYKNTLLTRFDNPAIKDQITRLCMNGSSKFPQYLRPSLQQALAQNRPHRLLTLALAGWLRYLTGIDEQGCEYVVDDPRAAKLVPLARESGFDPRSLLRLTEIFGELGDFPGFVSSLAEDLARLSEDGVRAALGEPHPAAPQRPSP